MDSPISRRHMCVGCGSEITDQYVLRVAPDLEWHASCLKCADCLQTLDENCTCFVKDGKTYCKEDYIRLFGTKCAKCGQRFARNDLVMRAKSKIYHLDCFSCSACGRQLVPGDEFALRDDGLLCKADHEAIERRTNYDYISTTKATEHDDSRTENNNNNNNNNNDDNKLAGTDSTSSHGSSSPIMHHGGSSRSAPLGGPGSGGGGGGGGHYHHGGRAGSGRGGHHHHHHKGEQKTTRIRTVLNEKQLHTLRTCYSANSRPDALMKEQLVEMTGLSPRVIRVWFQNKRCKDKKRSIVLKQLQQQNKNDRCILDDSSWLTQKGIPLIATSPVRHDLPSGLQASPVEVEKYPSPWSDLTELQSIQMEMHMEMQMEKRATTTPTTTTPTTTTTPFQQLMNSFGDAFDDDTVVSFDDLSDGPGGPGVGVGRLPQPPMPPSQQVGQSSHLQQQQQRLCLAHHHPSGLHPVTLGYTISGHY